ncbi:high mobility group B protein 13-like [Papaver somniferum]|uniref:high mobility group B protein 13-like n=1 Tax=Papaver somniferum TaxID=3469 RepID=UPI000E6FAC6B|nr:high mobility group B protein 13-like [Papaver somniferum]
MKKPSSYVLWCKGQWAEVKKENPDAEFKEVSNILGSKWKNVTKEDKKLYEEKKSDREAYLQIVGKEKRENEAMKLLEEDQKQKTAMELLEQYLQFKQKGAEGAGSIEAEKAIDNIHKQEALLMLKKNEKTENIIKLTSRRILGGGNIGNACAAPLACSIDILTRSKRASDARKRQALNHTNGSESFARKTFERRVKGLAIDPLTMFNETHKDEHQKLPPVCAEWKEMNDLLEKKQRGEIDCSSSSSALDPNEDSETEDEVDEEETEDEEENMEDGQYRNDEELEQHDEAEEDEE